MWTNFRTLAGGVALLLAAVPAMAQQYPPPPPDYRPPYNYRPAVTPLRIPLEAFRFYNYPPDSPHLVFYDPNGAKLVFYTNASAAAPIHVPVGGQYEVVVWASGDPAFGEWPRFRVRIDGREVGEITLTGHAPRRYRLPARLSPGDHQVAVEYVNDAFGGEGNDRNLYVEGVTLRPIGGRGPVDFGR